MNKKSNIIVVIMVALFIVTINLLNIFNEDKVFSESENRMLAQQPTITWKSIKNGRFTKKFEAYITDQFSYRDFWVGLKSDGERLLLKQDNNDVFFGDDGYLLENYGKPKEKTMNTSITSINYFHSIIKNMETYVLIPPTSIKVNEEKLPPFASPFDELVTLNGIKNKLDSLINFVDVYKPLKDKRGEYIYFRTDHHWTMRGAYYAYVELAKSMGMTPYSFDDFNSDIVTEEFFGTLYSKANNYHLKPDYIEVFTPKNKRHVEVNYVSEEKITQSLFEERHLNTKDKYAYFIDGNHPLVTIKSDITNGEKLIIFKNSYAHCFIPFLVNHFEEIHVVDLRFYKLNIYDYMRENDITKSLFLYDVLNFSKDDTMGILKVYK